MSNNAPPIEETQELQGGQGPALSPQVVAPFEAVLATIPDAGQQGYERILESIAGAKTAADLDAPWRSQGLEQYLGRELIIRDIAKMPSEYVGGLPFFLVVDAIEAATGQAVTFTTGAVSVVAQLVQASAIGALDGLRVIPQQSERPSASGTYPQHLAIVR